MSHHQKTNNNSDDDAQSLSESIPEMESEPTNVFDDREKNVRKDDDFDASLEDEEADDEALEAMILEPVPKKLEDGIRYRHRNWFLTYFSDDWNPDFSKDSRVDFGVYTKEVCPLTKRIHYHMYVEFNTAVDFHAVKTVFNCPSAHLQCRKGTQRQVILYVTKKRTRYPGFQPVYFGSPKSQGKRSDLDWMVECVLQGATKLEIVRYGGGNALRHINMLNSLQKCALGIDFTDNVVISRRMRAAAEGKSFAEAPDIATDIENAKDHIKAEKAFSAFAKNPSVYTDKSVLAPLVSIRNVPSELEKPLVEVLDNKKKKARKDYTAFEKAIADIKPFRRFSSKDLVSLSNRAAFAAKCWLAELPPVPKSNLPDAVTLLNRWCSFVYESQDSLVYKSIHHELHEDPMVIERVTEAISKIAEPLVAEYVQNTLGQDYDEAVEVMVDQRSLSGVIG